MGECFSSTSSWMERWTSSRRSCPRGPLSLGQRHRVNPTRNWPLCLSLSVSPNVQSVGQSVSAYVSTFKPQTIQFTGFFHFYISSKNYFSHIRVAFSVFVSTIHISILVLNPDAGCSVGFSVYGRILLQIHIILVGKAMVIEYRTLLKK